MRGFWVRPFRTWELLEGSGILFYQLWDPLEWFQQGSHEIWFANITSNIRDSFFLMLHVRIQELLPSAVYLWKQERGERKRLYLGRTGAETIPYSIWKHSKEKIGTEYWYWQTSVSCQHGSTSWDISTTLSFAFVILLLYTHCSSSPAVIMFSTDTFMPAIQNCWFGELQIYTFLKRSLYC